MKSGKAILYVFLILMVVPVFSIIGLSIKSNGSMTLGWYAAILQDENFLNALLLSTIVSIFTAILTTVISFIIGLSWFNKKQRLIVLGLVLLLGLLPPEVMAIAVSKISQAMGIQGANLFFLIWGLILYCLPFGVLIIWVRFFFIGDNLIYSAEDLGLTKLSVVLKVILPLSSSALITSLILSFLLSFNEYPRTYFLSGSYELVSEFLNGKLGSGTDNSIYAGGGIVICITLFFTFAFAVYQRFLRRGIKT